MRRLYENGVANGVPGVRVLDRAEETLAMEPDIFPMAVCGALYAPTCGHCRSRADMAHGAAPRPPYENGVELHLETAVTGAEKDHDAARRGGGAVLTRTAILKPAAVVNAAGVEADAGGRDGG